MDDKKPKPQRFYTHFMEKYPEIGSKYEALGEAIHTHGPLSERERALIKMAVSGSHLFHSAFKSHVRKGKKLGITREEMDHVALLMIPTVGFPTAMATLGLIDEQFDSEK